MSPHEAPVVPFARLTAPQAAMLARLATEPESTPGGTPDSGRHASAWHRTLDVLVRHGLATRTSNGVCSRAAITELGRRVLGAKRRTNG